MEPRRGYDISECRRCTNPCYVPISASDLGLCDECKQPGDWREDYDRRIEMVMTPPVPFEPKETPNPDAWIQRESA